MMLKSSHGNHIRTDANVFETEQIDNAMINPTVLHESEGDNTIDQNRRQEINKSRQPGKLFPVV